MISITVEILLISVFAGFIGSLLGLGGGIIITPALTLLLGIDIKYAIGASIVSVIATSSGSAIAYLRDKITNVRAGMFLEIATTTGALTGAVIAGVVSTRYLYLIFGFLLLYSAVNMFKKRNQELPQKFPENPMSDKLKLNGSYYDKALGQTVDYHVTGIYGGFGMMYAAGIISGLLGIGSGVFKVMAMDSFMKLPMKVSTATSNFMIGVTAAASAGIYLTRGNIDPKIAAPVALGVLLGAAVGTKVMQRLKSTTLRLVFIPVLLYVSVEMIMKGVKL
ncbi:sulfite exporter TauE/SafE family protein [Lacrimispora sp.]|uniref:sulfite exporter TauE/SafE family protein n=1 Tax=Lacrimispora sp. TaxID=2719234 RepID=UPI0039967EEA